ncbi:MAG: site-specific integrase [Clostridia bacterium]|nr:site-specific integrase [Clostridia bacterium]
MPKKRKRIEKKVTINGKRISVYGFSAFEISQKIEALEAEAERKKYPLFSEVLEDWKEEHFEKIAIGTQTCYTPAINRAKAEFKNTRLCDITAKEISALLKSLAALGYSQQTVKVQKTLISLVFSYAQSNDIVQYNPAEHAELPSKLPKKPRDIPDDDVIKKIMKSSDLTFGDFAIFLLLTGCRRGEALAVQWKDIDLKEKTITINKTVVYNGNKPILEDHTKTQSGMRTVVILSALIPVLREKRKGTSPDDFVFGKGQMPYTQTEFRRRWDKYVKEAEIDVTPHQLRHAYATILFDAKVDEKVAQTFMGHSKIEITRNIYTHLRQHRAAQAKKDINKFISKNFIQ